MMSGIRNILWLLPLLLLGTWPLWGSSMMNFLAPRGSFETPVASDSKGKTFTMQDVLFNQLKKGKEDWRIITNRLSSLPGSEDVMQMESVDARLYENNTDKFHIVSQNGSYDMAKQILTLRDNVKVSSQEGYTISSSLLRYDDNRKEIQTDEKVHVATDTMDIRGTGLVYNMKTGAYRIGGRVDFKVRK